jgi:GMP synthase (glutamine-hydrolysing)
MEKMTKDIYGQKILILDFGSQYTQLIARRVREAQVYCEIHPFHALGKSRLDLKDHPGGPSSIYDKRAPIAHAGILDLNVPVLGICYGMQYLAHALGGVVTKAEEREYGNALIKINDFRNIFHGFNRRQEELVWMSHGDRIEKMPKGFKSLASSKNSPVAAMADPVRKLFGVQFHPEVAHTPRGMRILKNFLFKVCRCKPVWTMSSFAERTIHDLREKVGEDRDLRSLRRG